MSLPHSHQDSSPHSESIAHAFVRGLALGTGALVAVTALGLGGIALASSATGGQFGAALNAILQSGDWTAPGDGTVKNAQALGGEGADKYLKLQAHECDPGFAISQITADGRVTCSKLNP